MIDIEFLAGVTSPECGFRSQLPTHCPQTRCSRCAGGFSPVDSIANDADVQAAAEFAAKEVCLCLLASSDLSNASEFELL